MIDPLSTLTSYAALQSAALELLHAAEALMQEPDDDVARDRMLAAIAKARGGSVAEGAPVVVGSDHNCWACEHDRGFVKQGCAQFIPDPSSDLCASIDDWLDIVSPLGEGLMPPRETVRACPGFKRAVKS